MTKPSSRRKPKNRKPIPASAIGAKPQRDLHTKVVTYPDGSFKRIPYRVRPLRVDVQQVLAAAIANPDPKFALACVPTVLLLQQLIGHPSNLCVQSCLLLTDVLDVLGVEANLVPVTVAVSEPCDVIAHYGEDQPRWEGTEFRGHCVVDVPVLERFIDPTVQQFDRLQGIARPIVGKAVWSDGQSHDEATGQMLPGTRIGVNAPEANIIYTVAEGGNLLVRGLPEVEQAREANIVHVESIVAAAIFTLRQSRIGDRLPAEFSRIHAYLAASGDAAFAWDGDTGGFAIGGRVWSLKDLIGTA